MNGRAGGWFGEHGEEIAQIFLELAKLAGVGCGCWVFDSERELRGFLLELAFDDLACAGDGVALVVEERFDVECSLYVAAPVEALAGAALIGPELGKLALPEAEDVGGDVAEFGDFADAEVELVRDVGPRGGGAFANWLVLRHARLRSRRCGRQWPVRSACCQYRPLT